MASKPSILSISIRSGSGSGSGGRSGQSKRGRFGEIGIEWSVMRDPRCGGESTTVFIGFGRRLVDEGRRREEPVPAEGGRW